jgi:hypothetical protein
MKPEDKAVVQQALEAMEYHTVQTRPLTRTQEAMDALHQLLEQPEPVQEPVAWMYDWEAEGELVRNWVSQYYDEAHSPTMGCHNIRPLYTTPPAAQPAAWVGLTDEEVDEAARYCVRTGQSVNSAIRAIEAKLREKNGGAA